MSITSRCLLAAGMMLALPATAFAQSAAPPTAPPTWPVSTAPARFTIDTNQDGPMGRLSQVPLYLPDPRWAGMPIRVFTDTGIAVGSDLLWTAPGEPATLLFDSSSGIKRYHVYMGSNWPPLHLPDAKAGVWIETRAGDGKVINHLTDLLQAWNQSTTVLGRAVGNGIYEGGNRFGPQADLFEHFQGWFDTPAAGHFDFATISVDASFVLIDGKEVVEWPGHHDWPYGPAGPPQGGVDLSAGLHMVDYYNTYQLPGDGRSPRLCSLVVKGGSFANWTQLNASSDFFRRVNSFNPASYELQTGTSLASGAVPALAIKWANKEQSVIYTDKPDIGLISMQLNSMTALPGTVTWTFDDGSTAQGQGVTHLFPRPGLRTVQVTVKDGDRQVATLSQTISVHPDWLHPEKQSELRAEQEADIMSRDPATLPAYDLAGCLALFVHYLKPDDILKLLPSVVAKMKDMKDTDLPDVKDAALYLISEDWTHFAEESQLLHAVIDRAAAAPSSPQMIAVASEGRLALARLIFKTSDQLNDAHAVVDGINASALTGDDARVLAILRADLTLAGGDVAGARKQYQALTGDPSGPDVRSSIRRTARIAQARAYIDQKDYAAAEDALNEVAWQSPLEKLSPDWALTRLRLYQEENLPMVAYLWATRLMPVITEGGRSELLFRLTGLAFAQGDTALAGKTLAELLQKHPYSDEAAQAKARWPGKE